jgi:hypothetical protein
MAEAMRLRRPGEFVEFDNSFIGINGGNQANVVFVIEAKFSNRCCEFRQDVRGKQLDGSFPNSASSALQWTDDKYNAEEDPEAYRDNSDGSVKFFDYDHAGTLSERTLDLFQNGQRDFASWLSFRGYVVDTCNGGRRIGPSKQYGFIANGKYPSITVTTWGFDQPR